MYFAFGTDDVYVIATVPDNKAALAMAAAVCSTGAISSYETVVLLDPSEVDEALNLSIDYSPPGG